MNKLDELIAALCPDGIDIKKVGDICDTITDYTAAGSFADIAKNVKYINDGVGYAQLIRTTDLKSAFKNIDKFIYVDEHAFNYLWRVNLDSECLVLPNVGNCGEVYYVTPDILPFSHNVLGPNSILVKSSIIDNRYLFHAFQSKKFQKKLAKITSTTGQTKFNKTNFKALSLPVPPLEVQREIVRVLDSFTLLTAELTAELTARKKQYEFYGNRLLTLDSKIKKVQLGDVCTFVRGPFGGALKKEIFQTEGYAVYEQQHAIYHNLDFRYYIDKNKFSELKRFAVNSGDMIVSCSGTIGKTFVIPKNAPEGIINQALLKLTPNEKLNVFYLQYFFENTISKILNEAARGGAIKNVPSVNELKAIELPLPSLNVQQKLVDVLDNFETICNDLSIGLPAEIEARQKQYEYYRDLLLTFAETGSTIMTDRQTDRTEHN